MSREKTRLFCPGTSDLNGTGKGLRQTDQSDNQVPMWGYEILQERDRVRSMLKRMKELNFSNKYISTTLHCAASDARSQMEKHNSGT